MVLPRRIAFRLFCQRFYGRPKDVHILPPEIIPKSKSNPDTNVDPSITSRIYEIVTKPVETPNGAKVSNTFKMLLNEFEPQPKDGKNRSIGASRYEAVQNLLHSFRKGNAPILPRIEILNDALMIFALQGRRADALELYETMSKTYGIRPNEKSMEIVAFASVRSKNYKDAQRIMNHVNTVSDAGQEVYNSLILFNMMNENVEGAMKIFNELRSKALPNPKVASTVILQLGKREQVERSFLIHKELVSQGMIPTAECYSALIFAASKRKEYFEKALDIFRQMEILKMKIELPVYNNLLYACGKVSNLETALSLWKTLLTSDDPALKPNQYTCCNFIWAISSAESWKVKISNRNFSYNMEPKELVNSAKEVIQYMHQQKIPMSSHTLSAFLAVFSNNRIQDSAEDLFWNEYPRQNIPWNPFSYELMFKLYDNIRSYEGALKVYEQWDRNPVIIPYEGWRALIRVSAITNNLEDTIKYANRMKSQGYEPYSTDFETVIQIFFANERQDLLQKFLSICVSKPAEVKNPFLPWLNRSNRVAQVLQDAYGDQAPELATRRVK